MTKFFISLFLSVAISNTFANKIDDLKTSEDVENLIHSLDKKYKDFSVLETSSLYFNTLQQQTATALGVKNWQKADLDNNGLMDLLVYGRWSSELYLIAIMDDGKKLNVHSLTQSPFGELLFPVIKKKEKETLLVLYKGCDYCRGKENKITDTIPLIYKFNDFIEQNAVASPYRIDKIKFSTTACFGTCPVFELEINANRTAKYNAIEYNEDQKGTFTAKIDTANYNSIIQLLDYVDFPGLKNNYAVGWTDYPTCNMEITYDNGQVKKIEDYGEQGTYGLSMIYAKFFSLRDNQKWKKY